MTAHRARLIAQAVAYLGLCLVIGHFVSRGPVAGFDASGAALFGVGTPLAIFASQSGLFPAYLGIAIAAIVAGIARRAFLGRALFLAAALLATWKANDAAKLLFHRARLERWLWVHETSPSYPSGHASLAIAGYGLLAAYVWRSGLPARERRVLAGALVLWVLTIDWSRMALGAHYPSDVIGGALLGFGVVTLGRAIYDPFAGASRAGDAGTRRRTSQRSPRTRKDRPL